MKIIEYKILASSTDTNTLVAEVNEAIEDGWQPLGAMAEVGNPKHFIQTIVKYEERESR